MFNLNNTYIYTLFTILITYTAYNFLWTRFGLGVTSVVQYMLLVFVILGAIIYLIKPSICKHSWTNWLIMLWLTQVMAFFFGDSNATTQFKESTFVLLTATPIVSMTYSTKYIKRFFIIMATVSIAMYFVTMSMMRIDDENSYGGGYMILVALPVFLYFFRNKSLLTQMIITIILFILVLTSMKRGDIIAAILGIGVFFLVKLKGSGKFDYRIIAIIVIIALIGYFAFTYLIANNDIFAWRFQQTLDGDSSNRDTIYSKLWHYFLNAPLDIKFFGGGFDATLKICGVRAHSDLLEVLSCEGIVGLLAYLGAFFSLLRQVFCRNNVTEKAVLAFILVIWTVKMVFSMFIYAQPTIILFALTAYILNNNRRYEYQYAFLIMRQVR